MVPRHGTPLTASVVTPSEGHCVWVRLAGDVDLAAESALAEVVDRLNGLVMRRVDVDLGAVTFAGATLVHFLEAIHRAHPGTALELHRPSPVARHIMQVTGVDQFAVTNDNPLSSAPALAASLAGDVEPLPSARIARVGHDEAFNGVGKRVPDQRADSST